MFLLLRKVRKLFSPDFDNAPPFLRRHMRAIDFRQLNISENALYVKKWLDFLMSRCEQ